MPVKRTNGGTTVNVDEVFEIAEMYGLANEWFQHPYEFESVQLERYRELCARYGMDSSILLYSVQNRNLVDVAPDVEQTKTFPVVEEVPQNPAQAVRNG